jgi:hypothetical protein
MDQLTALYADGYVHDQQKLNDTSPYEEGRNTFYDILNKLPEAKHGRLIRLTLHKNGHEFPLEWATLPENARPIRYREMKSTITQHAVTGEEISHDITVTKLVFGYQYNDETGKNHTVVQEIN